MRVVWLRHRLILCVSVVIVLTFCLLIFRATHSNIHPAVVLEDADLNSQQANTRDSIVIDLVTNTTDELPAPLEATVLSQTETAAPVSTEYQQSLSSIYEQINAMSSRMDCGHPRLVLLIQVHNRLQHLEQLLESLEQNQFIRDTLIITSHDLYSPHIHELVTSVRYTRVIPIYYPYSQQLHNNTFPGPDPNDCPKRMQREEALRINCNNADTPDQYGNYREAQFTSIKHHWFWKIITVFEKLDCLRGYTGHVLFLEEDHYTSPDFVATALQLVELRNASCPECDFINMGVYQPKNTEGASNVFVYEWVAGEHNMGFGMDRGTWDRIKSCADYFCKFDDYNWDWSLEAVGLNCLNKHFVVLSMGIPRIFHLGKCGVHQTGQGCDPKQLAELAKMSFLRRDHLSQDKLILVGPVKPLQQARMPNPRGFGGWGDRRDHKLCLDYLRDEFPVAKLDLTI